MTACSTTGPRTPRRAGAVALAAAMVVALASPAYAAVTVRRVSVSSTGVQADGPSARPAVTGSGRYVVFQSTATDLVGGDTNRASDVFLRDRRTGRTIRVSTTRTGAQADGASVRPSVSADGRYVVFWSTASNLVGGDTNGTQDLYLKDRSTGAVSRLDVTPGGSQSSGGGRDAVISGNGRYVAFTSPARDLVAGRYSSQLESALYYRDLVTGTTRVVSTYQGGAQPLVTSGEDPSISADGRYVAWQAPAWDPPTASGRSLGDPGYSDVYLWDRRTGTNRHLLTRTSTALCGSSGYCQQFDDGAWNPSLSADGRWVAFGTDAWGIAGIPAEGHDLLLENLATGGLRWVTRGVSLAGDLVGSPLAISGDGSRVAYTDPAAHVTREWTRATRTTTRVPGAGDTTGLSLDATGGRLALDTVHALTAKDTNRMRDVYLRSTS